ncbi:MAG TPA: hypothetical protein PLB55_14510 [Prosthecobacter sp.]|nr:hypothetical protein [Prosthecobacter sp.]
MKLLERLFDHDAPVQVGSALLAERPTWLVTCILKRQEVFGDVSIETSYEVAARSEEQARKSVRSFVRQSQPEFSIESMLVTLQPRQ